MEHGESGRAIDRGRDRVREQEQHKGEDSNLTLSGRRQNTDQTRPDQHTVSANRIRTDVRESFV